jgi:DNA-binding NtrC family response regulator
VPPLRERRSDIPLLVRHILSKAAVELGRQVPGVSRDVMAHLMARDWPGNVQGTGERPHPGPGHGPGQHPLPPRPGGDRWGSGPDRLPTARGVPRVPGGGPAGSLGGEAETGPRSNEDSLAAVERRHVQRVLLMTKGNKSAAARILEVSRPTLNRMIKDYEILCREGAVPSGAAGSA